MPQIDLRNKTDHEIIKILDKNGLASPIYKKSKKMFGAKGTALVDRSTFRESLIALIPHYHNRWVVTID